VAGHGVELDWLRAFWDVHTDGVPPPTFTAMLDWFGGATPWSRSTAYTEIDEEADVVLGQINAVWDWTKVQNGVDH
jgi:hypothetical protein